MRKILLTVLAIVLGASPLAWADAIDPSTLHLGPGAGTACAMGCGGDPNTIGPSVLDIFQTGGGFPTLLHPVLLILGVPNNTANLFSTNPISSVTSYNPYPGAFPGGGVTGSSAFATAGTYGLTAAVGGGFFGSMTSGQEIYSFLTLQPPTNASNSFTNWSALDLAINSISATSFGIYVFAINADLGSKGLIDIGFSAPLPLGTYAVAYGQSPPMNPRGDYFVFSTPFTEAGLVVPEPGTLLLFGAGLLSMAGVVRRRLAR